MARTQGAKVQKFRDLISEMKAVARREKPAPRDAARTSYESVDAVLRLLTPENRALLGIIRDRRPNSIAELADLTGRSQPNLTRTLGKMESAGFVVMAAAAGRRKAPRLAAKRVSVTIDPCATDRDALRIT